MRRNEKSKHGLKLVVASDYESMSRRAAIFIRDFVEANPRALLGLATGSTPSRAYDLTSSLAAKQSGLFGAIRILKLDEWGGLAMDDPASCETYLHTRVLKPWRVPPSRYRGWNSLPQDKQAECNAMAQWLDRHGPIDLCILGLGANGHLAFNEPAASLEAKPHAACLAPGSMKHAMLDDARGKPLFGLTIGMAGILGARKILLLVHGPRKRRQLKKAVAGPVTTRFPGSFLQLHPDVTLICDREAARDLIV
jgi:galactosamine-6-phosphate isomerase